MNQQILTSSTSIDLLLPTDGAKIPDRKDHIYLALKQQDLDTIDMVQEEENTGDISLNSHEFDETETSLTRGSTKDISFDGDEFANPKYSELTLKLLSALFYGVCSFLISVINKLVLTTYSFPSSNILGIGQMVAILLILQTAQTINLVKIRRVSIRNKKLFILAGLYLANLITSLGGTKSLPLPMFIALRRFSIALTAILEFIILGLRRSIGIILTIVAMIGGSIVAALADLSFNAIGYLQVMLSNIFSAAGVVYTKKTIDSKEINKHEILYYNALLTILPLITISYFTNDRDELINYKYWNDTGFIIAFLTSCVMGYLLMYSTILCTHYNSALTTTIVGTLKVSDQLVSIS